MSRTSALAGIAAGARLERISYPLSYKHKDLQRQLEILQAHWPQINVGPARELIAHLKRVPAIPEWLEAPFCILNPDVFGTYASAVEEVLDALIHARANNRTSVEDRLRTVYLKKRSLPSALRLTARTQEFHDRLRATQRGDVWIVYGQFGWHHRSQSVAEVRENYDENEYGFGLLEALCMLLTHRRRLVNSDALQIECPGDGLIPGDSAEPEDAAFLHVWKGKLSVDAANATVPTPRAGSLTGVLPML